MSWHVSVLMLSFSSKQHIAYTQPYRAAGMATSQSMGSIGCKLEGNPLVRDQFAPRDIMSIWVVIFAPRMLPLYTDFLFLNKINPQWD